MWLYYKSHASKRSWRNCEQCRPWSDCSSRSSLIWVCTVWLDLSVGKLRIITVVFLFSQQKPKSVYALKKMCLYDVVELSVWWNQNKLYFFQTNFRIKKTNLWFSAFVLAVYWCIKTGWELTDLSGQKFWSWNTRETFSMFRFVLA